MLNTAAKFYFTVAVLAAGAAFGYTIAEDDLAGTTLLWFLMAVAGLAGLVAAGSGINDRAPWVGEDAPIAETPVGPAAAARPSPWPIAGAVGVGVMGVGLALGAGVVVAGVVACLLAAAGWLGQAWGETPGWDVVKGGRLSERILAPLGVPLGAFVLVAVVVVAVSRVLLAVDKDVSVAVALLAAVIVLVIFALLAARPRVSRGVMTGLVAVSGVGIVTAGVAGAAMGEREFHGHDEHATELRISAKDTQFDKNALTAPAHEEFHVRLVNNDPAIYHNVAVYTALEGGRPVIAGAPITGVDRITYTWEIDNPGGYFFRCDFHANMTGTFTVR